MQEISPLLPSFTTTHQLHDPGKNHATLAHCDVETLRHAIMVERWVENRSKNPSSASSIILSETQSSSPTPLQKPMIKIKSKAQRIYADLKKAKEPISPCGRKIANFLNSVFSSKTLSKGSQNMDQMSSIRKSKSMKDTTTTTIAPQSCLIKNPSCGGTKSKRSVRFCDVNVILDENEHDLDNLSCTSSDLFELDNIGFSGSNGEELPVYATTSVNHAIA